MTRLTKLLTWKICKGKKSWIICTSIHLVFEITSCITPSFRNQKKYPSKKSNKKKAKDLAHVGSSIGENKKVLEKEDELDSIKTNSRYKTNADHELEPSQGMTNKIFETK